MESKNTLRKTPSRDICEGIIKRILMTEVLQKGKNENFRSAADFMTYFESLYPASEALTKQVQRAVKALDMPKDESGYFIPNRTADQLAHENEMKALLKKADASIERMDECVPVFLKSSPSIKSYLIHMIKNSPLFSGKFVTVLETDNGILFYTRNGPELELLLKGLIVR